MGRYNWCYLISIHHSVIVLRVPVCKHAYDIEKSMKTAPLLSFATSKSSYLLIYIPTICIPSVSYASPMDMISNSSTQLCSAPYLKQVLERLHNGLVSYLLLNEHTSSSKHSKTAILDLLCGHFFEISSILWFQAKWIKTNVTWIV